MQVRCLEGLAEIVLAEGDTTRSRVYADELFALAQANGLRELEAVARRWRGEAQLLEQDYAAAQTELSLAAKLAEDIGRVRLHMDSQNALARLCDAQGQHDVAQGHKDKARAIAQAIEASLDSSGLQAQINI